jgi:glycerate dehydrogenase
MKDGAILINTARGPLVDECALRDALDSGKLAGAGCDVVSAEPIKQDNPLLQAKNIIITPHISWASKQARQRLMDITAENLRSYLGGQIINRVN